MNRPDESTRDPQTPVTPDHSPPVPVALGAASTIAAVAPAAFTDGRDRDGDDHDPRSPGREGEPGRSDATSTSARTPRPNLAPGGIMPARPKGSTSSRWIRATVGWTLSRFVDTPNPSFLAIDPTKKYLSQNFAYVLNSWFPRSMRSPTTRRAGHSSGSGPSRGCRATSPVSIPPRRFACTRAGSGSTRRTTATTPSRSSRWTSRTGTLSVIDWESTRGQIPRACTSTPPGPSSMQATRTPIASPPFEHPVQWRAHL